MLTTILQPTKIIKVNDKEMRQLHEQAAEKGQVIFHCYHHSCYDFCSGSCQVSLNPGVLLMPHEGGEPSSLLHLYNMELAPLFIKKVYDLTNFTIVFSGLPKHCDHFDFIEPDDDGAGWELTDIARNKSNVYKLYIKRRRVWLGM